MTDTQSLDTLLADLHEELRATETLPVERRASQWLGEAQAVAADAASGVPESVVETRIEQVGHLLENVEETGNEEADAHVQQAHTILGEIEALLDSERQ